MQGASSRLVVETLTHAHRTTAYVYVQNASRGWAGTADLKAALPPQSVVVKPSTANTGGWPQALGEPQLHATWVVSVAAARMKKKRGDPPKLST